MIGKILAWNRIKNYFCQLSINHKAQLITHKNKNLGEIKMRAILEKV